MRKVIIITFILLFLTSMVLLLSNVRMVDKQPEKTHMVNVRRHVLPGMNMSSIAGQIRLGLGSEMIPQSMNISFKAGQNSAYNKLNDLLTVPMFIQTQKVQKETDTYIPVYSYGEVFYPAVVSKRKTLVRDHDISGKNVEELKSHGRSKPKKAQKANHNLNLINSIHDIATISVGTGIINQLRSISKSTNRTRNTDGNLAIIRQNGHVNDAEVAQTLLFTYQGPRIYNFANIEQEGNQNTAIIQQKSINKNAIVNSMVNQAGNYNKVHGILASASITQTKQTQKGSYNYETIINYSSDYSIYNSGYYQQKQKGNRNTAKVTGGLFAGTIKQIQSGNHNRSVMKNVIRTTNSYSTRQMGNHNTVHLSANDYGFGGSFHVTQYHTNNTAIVTWHSNRRMTSIYQNGNSNYAKVVQK